jgi:hypothetical protein
MAKRPSPSSYPKNEFNRFQINPITVQSMPNKIPTKIKQKSAFQKYVNVQILVSEKYVQNGKEFGSMIENIN